MSSIWFLRRILFVLYGAALSVFHVLGILAHHLCRTVVHQMPIRGPESNLPSGFRFAGAPYLTIPLVIAAFSALSVTFPVLFFHFCAGQDMPFRIPPRDAPGFLSFLFTILRFLNLLGNRWDLRSRISRACFSITPSRSVGGVEN